MNRRTDDEGSILIMALFFLTAIFFLVVVPLTYADTNLRADVSLRHNQQLQATADSALDVAVDAFRTRTDQGTAFQGTAGSPQPCPWTGSPDWQTPPSGFLPSPHADRYALNGWTVSVSCVGLVPSGNQIFQRRDVVFTVTCVSAPAGQACPSTTAILRSRDLFFDPPTFTSQVTQVKTWSEDF